MKKIFIMLIIICMITGLVACGGSKRNKQVQIGVNNNNVTTGKFLDNENVTIETTTQSVEVNNNESSEDVKNKETESDSTVDDNKNDDVEQESTTKNSSSDKTGIRKEFKEAMDSYEAFFDEYIKFMKEYTESDDVLGMLAEYTNYLQKYTEAMEKMSELGEGEMSKEEALYYSDVTSRISKKLIELAD